MKAVVSWLARTVLLYVLLALAIGFAMLVLPNAPGALEGWREDTAGIAEVNARIAAARDDAQMRLERSGQEIQALPLATIDARIAEREQRRAALERALADQQDDWLARYRPSRIVQRKRAEIEIALTDSELAMLKAARQPRRDLERARRFLQSNPTMPTQAAIASAARLCGRDRRSLSDFEERWAIEQRAREALLSQRSELEAAVEQSCALPVTLAERRSRALQAARQAREAQGALAALTTDPLPDDFSADISRTMLSDVLQKALLALLAILLLPLAIRVLLYYALAPLAQKWPPMRFRDPGDAPAFAPAEPSRVSLAITLGAQEEALVRQDFLQSSSLQGVKRTRWLLDWSAAITSFVSGMRFLTAIRGEGEEVLVSAVKDPLAELALLEIPAGGAAIVRPSALAGLVQNTDDQIRITTHWRLLSLPAWLTFQLRYLAFHGPARLMLKGGRGVRIEPAQRGRIVGQGQLIGFSTDCAYSVVRSETFWPYFFGRESLLKDRVEEGRGVLLIEEAPLAGRSGLRRGFEGSIDAVFKLFGV